MGVLDDAIREHIELKREHGASETDLKRQEQEALGPARRESSAPAEPVGEDPVAGPPGEDSDVAATELVPHEADPEPEPDPASFVDAEPDALEDVSPEPDTFSDSEPEAEEDVLEETPEFLQETPEHDRLWFEQKPPRDFDFDE